MHVEYFFFLRYGTFNSKIVFATKAKDNDDAKGKEFKVYEQKYDARNAKTKCWYVNGFFNQFVPLFHIHPRVLISNTDCYQISDRFPVVFPLPIHTHTHTHTFMSLFLQPHLQQKEAKKKCQKN